MSEIFVEGKTSRKVSCDRMEIKIDFNSTGVTARNVMPQVMDDCEKFLEEMEKKGYPPACFMMESDSARENRYREISCELSREISFKAPMNLSLVNLILDVIRKNDLHAEYRVNYGYSELNQLHEELAREAFADSERKARMIAEGMGKKDVTLKKVIINPFDDSEWNVDDKYCKEVNNVEANVPCRGYAESRSSNMKPLELDESETIKAVWCIE